ncbi:MAG: Fmu (Sun) domain protein [Bacteroidota bacterium]
MLLCTGSQQYVPGAGIEANGESYKTVKSIGPQRSAGGKSTHIQSLLSKDSLLVSNDVIRSRANILKDNIIKWGGDNVVVTNNDPKDFAKLDGYFDVIVADAPCSGSGLFRREPEAMNEWSLNNVALCSQRQQRILADVWPALKKGGILIYSTCSYSKEEDEEIMDWMMRELGVMSYELGVSEDSGIVQTLSASGAVGYRFWPDKVKGEGFFIACFQKKEGEESVAARARSKAVTVTKSEMAMVERWIKTTGHQFIKNENTVYAWPESLAGDMNFILSNLRVIYSGVRTGELMRDKLVPDHALAMSRLTADAVISTELNYEQAIQYLQRKDMQVETREKGWQLVSYLGHPLGWINALANRLNNYYPKELRILKENNL